MEEGEQEEEKDVNTKPEEEETPTKPRPLHRTNSIFLRNLAPTITKQEVEAVSTVDRHLMPVILRGWSACPCFCSFLAVIKHNML